MSRTFDVAQREFDKKFVCWVEMDRPDIDRDWYLKNNLAVPQIWVPLAVAHSREAAIRVANTVKL